MIAADIAAITNNAVEDHSNQKFGFKNELCYYSNNFDELCVNCIILISILHAIFNVKIWVLQIVWHTIDEKKNLWPNSLWNFLQWRQHQIIWSWLNRTMNNRNFQKFNNRIETKIAVKWLLELSNFKPSGFEVKHSLSLIVASWYFIINKRTKSHFTFGDG